MCRVAMKLASSRACRHLFRSMFVSAVPGLTADIAHGVATFDATDETSRRFVGPAVAVSSSIIDAVRVGQARTMAASG